MFSDQHPRRQSFSRVALDNRNFGLGEHRTIIEFGSDLMNRAACNLVARGQRSFVRVQALILGQQ